MAEYYFISQLPSLDGIGENDPLPIDEDRFYELCDRFLGRKLREVLKKITVSPPKKTESSGSSLVDRFSEWERNLRFALGKVRAEKMGKEFDTENIFLSAEFLRAARSALEMENPLEAEKYLNRYRLDFLETLRPMDGFSEEYIFYYGLKLKLLLRLRCFDTEKGEAAYWNIYNSVLNGEGLEAKK